MELQFVVKILDSDTVDRLEHEEDTVFSSRIKTLIVAELVKWNENFNRADVHVIETPVKRSK